MCKGLVDIAQNLQETNILLLGILCGGQLGHLETSQMALETYV